MKIYRSNYILLLLFFASIACLTYKLNSHPSVLFNWEHYTTWRMYQKSFGETLHNTSYTIFGFNDGLMTDSGLSPILYFPILLISKAFNNSLFFLRIWPVLFGTATVSLFYVFVKKYFGYSHAIIASSVLLFSQPFLLYSRTATNVGISLFFSLITIWVMIEFWMNKRKFQYYLFLIGLIFINSFLYSPLRFLAPIGLLLIIWQGSQILTSKFSKKYTFFLFFLIL